MPVPLRSAVVLGATGLVGTELVRALSRLPTCESTVTLGRRPSGLALPRVIEVTADLARPETYRAELARDCVFCALGTTIKKAGSEAAFRTVDYDYPLWVAREALAAGAKRYVLVSSVGAHAKSPVFYSRVKGELEEALASLSFPRGLRVLHPSILLGERTESRPGEHVAQVLMRATGGLFVGGLTKYRAINAADVARAMITAAESDGEGVVVYEGKSLFDAVQYGLQTHA